jgi:hypothetical protein
MRNLNLLENLKLIYRREDINISDVLDLNDKNDFDFFKRANSIIQIGGFLDHKNLRACAADFGVELPEIVFI